MFLRFDRTRNAATQCFSPGNTDGGGFEPPVPFGTHAFQACTINHSVTHPEDFLFLSVLMEWETIRSD